MDVDEALYYAELSAATGLERVLAAEVRRLRAQARVDLEVIRLQHAELTALRAMKQRAQAIAAGRTFLAEVDMRHVAREILGEVS